MILDILQKVIAIVSAVVTLASILHTILPPWDAEAIAQFPRFQKVYKLTIYFLGYAAIAQRSNLWRQLSTDNGKKPSDAAINSGAAQLPAIIAGVVDTKEQRAVEEAAKT